MNYLPVVGWWYYGGASAAETANYSASWGLLGKAPAGTPASAIQSAWKVRIPSRVCGMTIPQRTMTIYKRAA